SGHIQPLPRPSAPGGAAPHVVDHANADINVTLPSDAGPLHGFDRVGPVVAQPGLDHAIEPAEPQHHADLIGLDLENAGEQPYDDQDEHEQRKPLAAETAGKHGPELVLAATQQLFEIRGRWTRRLGPRTPRPLGA